MTTKGRLWTESTIQSNESEDGCKSKPEIDESRASADGRSTNAGVQAERYQEKNTGSSVRFTNRVDSSEWMVNFLMLQNDP